MIFEKHYITNDKDVYLMSYCFEETHEIPYHKKRPAVLVCPGGGYGICSKREADPVAMQYAAEGYNTFVLYYSLNEKAVFPNSLLDLCAAMKFIRENAEKFDVIEDKIAVCGFSAGGHLAASLGVYWNDPEIMEKSGCLNSENKPNALILGYPVISTSWMENGEGAGLKRVTGGNSDPELYKKLNLHTAVTKDTPQTFLAHTVRDTAVPVEDSINFASALIGAGVPCEMHIFPNGGHGLSLSNGQVCADGGDKSFAQWVNLSVNWLERLFSNPDEANAPLNKAKYSSKY